MQWHRVPVVSLACPGPSGDPVSNRKGRGLMDNPHKAVVMNFLPFQIANGYLGFLYFFFFVSIRIRSVSFIFIKINHTSNHHTCP